MPHNPDTTASEQLIVLERLLEQTQQRHTSFAVVELRSHAKIPLLKLRYASRLDVDLSVQNLAPFSNAHLLKMYGSNYIRPVVFQLTILVKHWAKTEDVCGATGGHLSSYSWTLMVIYFLQVHPDVKLPCIPTAWFELNHLLDRGSFNSLMERDLLWHWQCNSSVSVLIAEFFKFYATIFRWGGSSVNSHWKEREL